MMKHRQLFMKHYVKSHIILEPFESSCGGPKILTPSFSIHCYSFVIDNPASTVKYVNKLFTCRSKEVMHKFVLNWARSKGDSQKCCLFLGTILTQNRRGLEKENGCLATNRVERKKQRGLPRGPSKGICSLRPMK